MANYNGPRRPLRRINRSLVERRDVYAGCEVYLPPKKLGSFEGELRRLPKRHEIQISNRLFGYGGERNAYEARFITHNGFTTAEEACTHHRIRTRTRTRTCTRHAHMHTCTPDQMRVHRAPRDRQGVLALTLTLTRSGLSRSLATRRP